MSELQDSERDDLRRRASRIAENAEALALIRMGDVLEAILETLRKDQNEYRT